MIEVPIYQVDTFSSHAFGGNPSAICPLDEFLDAEILQSIARENNLSETAFMVPSDVDEADYDLRWFTPTVETVMSGHATVAAGHIVMTVLEPELDRVRFRTRSGIIETWKDDGRYAVRLPKTAPDQVEESDGLAEAIGAKPIEVFHKGRDFLLAYDNAKLIRKLEPDMKALTAFDPYGFLCTAPGTGDVDFVSRCFFPNLGIPEDPVTGSAYTTLAPYWAERLGKTKLHALQISSRGGELWIELEDEHVVLSGHVVDTMHGTLMVS